MLVGRSVQGVGAGGLLALTQVLLTDMVPLLERGKFLALISIVWAIGSVSGPSLGGGLAQRGAWRWIFWINLPIMAVGAVGIIAFLRLHHRAKSTVAKLAEMDWVGSFISTSSTTSFLIPITWGGVLYPWSSWRTLVPLSLGAAGLLVFCLYEAKTGTVTIVPLPFFKNPTTSVSYFGTFIHGMILWFDAVLPSPLFSRCPILWSCQSWCGRSSSELHCRALCDGGRRYRRRYRQVSLGALVGLEFNNARLRHSLRAWPDYNHSTMGVLAASIRRRRRASVSLHVPCDPGLRILYVSDD